MVEVENFQNPPIVEAILSIEVPHLDDLTTSATTFHDRIAHDFPQRLVLSEREAVSLFPLEVQAVIAAPGPRRQLLEPPGYTFTSTDHLEVVRVTKRGVSVHRLAPYPGWKPFEDRSRLLWQAFVDSFQPERVSNIRLRYLNRIPIPRTTEDLRDYLCTYPEVAGPIDTGLSGYLMRLSLTDPAVPARASLTQRADAGFGDGETFTLLFDVDVLGKRSSYPQGDLLWDYVQGLREYKNRIFFGSITPRMKDLFR